MASAGSFLRFAAIVLVAGYTTHRLYDHLTATIDEPNQPPLSPAASVIQETIRHPVAIFSKTYCGYSKKAKRIMDKYLDHYAVVELDEHHLGPEIQNLMYGITGGSTVPRVFVKGAFVGGADDLEALDNRGELVKLLKSKGIAVKG